MHFGDSFWMGAGGATAVGAGVGRVTWKVRQRMNVRRAATARRNLLIDGAPAVVHISPKVKGIAERLETIERVQGDQGATLAAQDSQLKTMLSTLDRLEKKFDGNGGDTQMTGDVIQRIAKKLGVWEL
jgi:tetrahydromethanopterin S-methyltransferase subunit G